MVPGLNKQLILDDMTDTTTAVVLGLIAVAPDATTASTTPSAKRDYYRFQALFGAHRGQGRLRHRLGRGPSDPGLPPRSEHEARVDLLRRQIESIEHP